MKKLILIFSIYLTSCVTADYIYVHESYMTVVKIKVDEYQQGNHYTITWVDPSGKITLISDEWGDCTHYIGQKQRILMK